MSKELKDSIFSSVEENFEELKAIKKYLYDNPEVGGEEEKSSAIVMDFLKKNGFEVRTYHGYRRLAGGVLRQVISRRSLA